MVEQTDFNFTFPNLENKPQEINLTKGDILFVLGANGTGKSGLMHLLYSQNTHNVKRIYAHRQTWFPSNAMEITSSQKLQTESNISGYDIHVQSRWRDDYSGQRSQITLFDLINAENKRARKAAAALDIGERKKAEKILEKNAPMKILNHLLKISNLPIDILIGDNDQLFASKNGGGLYSIAELSDGERNSILIAADVLTARKDTLFIIDEPERHLHRSIISPLLTALFRQRPDCTFVISTHDIGLSLDNPEAGVLLVRGCQWNEAHISGWDTDLISSVEQIDYQIKQDILGSRRKLLFVEGNESSLDLNIYQILFPEVSVIPQGNCNDVERAVYGISSTDSLHWVKAIGLVDSDDRSKNEIDNLKNKNVYALPCYSVESIYYCVEIIEKLAEKSAEMHGGNSSDLISNAYKNLISAIEDHKDRLCARLCERKIKQKINLPDWEYIQSQSEFNINIDIATDFNREKNHFDEYISNQDITSIISRYPIRETPALGRIARSLKFSNRRNYEAAVRKLLIDDVELKNQIRSKFGELVQAIESDTDIENRDTQAT